MSGFYKTWVAVRTIMEMGNIVLLEENHMESANRHMDSYLPNVTGSWPLRARRHLRDRPAQPHMRF
jgi:hypothetical protein